MGVVLLALLYLRAPRMKIVDAQAGPSITMRVTLNPAPRGRRVGVIVQLHDLTYSTDANFSYRIDMIDLLDMSDADNCEDSSMGSDQSLDVVDANPEYVVGFTSAACPPGSYRVQVHLKDAANVELASGQADLTIFPVTDTPTPTPTSIFEGYSGWRAEYYDNASLSGRPVLVRDDANINFNWGSRSPATDVPTDNFSVRWQRFITFDDDRIYRFKLKKNDGARVWFDDRLIIDLWDDDNDSRTYYTELPVTAGRHAFRVEYREDDYNAHVRFWWERKGVIPTVTSTPMPTTTATATPTRPPQGDSSWRGEYFTNRGVSGTPAATRYDASINFDWGQGRAHPDVRGNEFSVRWTRNFFFDGGRYRFSVRRNDGVRVWIDGQLTLDRWSGSAGPFNQTYSTDVTLLTGLHRIRVEYYENDNIAYVSFWWTKLSLPTFTPTHTPTPTPTPTAYATRPLEKNNRWRAEFYPNQILSGFPTGNGSYSSLNFNWGSGYPVYGVPSDHFSARWDRIVTLDGGLYRFSLEKDDGARVWVNEQLIIDHWQDCCDEGERFEAELPLIAGDHIIRVEYYEKEGNARVKFWWNWIGPLPTPTPVPATWSATMTVGNGGGYSGYGLSTGGTLTDSDFAWRGTTYTLEAILHNPFSDTLSVEFAAEIGTERENLSLCLGAIQFDLAQARSPNNRQFFWDNVDPDWSDGDTVTVGVHGCGG